MIACLGSTDYELDMIGHDVIRRNHSLLPSQPRAWVEDEVSLRAGRLVRFVVFVSATQTQLDEVQPVEIRFQVRCQPTVKFRCL